MLRRAIAAVVKTWGNSSAKQRIWDSEYSTGRWTYDREGQNNEGSEPIYGVLESYCANGSILDLGCGSGMTVLEMKNNFSEYVGVDVSAVAIEKARAALATEGDRAAKISFMVSDISTFDPGRNFSVILFRESINYVPLRQIRPVLKNYFTYLLSGWSSDRAASAIAIASRKIVEVLTIDFDGEEIFRANNIRQCPYSSVRHAKHEDCIGCQRRFLLWAHYSAAGATATLSCIPLLLSRW